MLAQTVIVVVIVALCTLGAGWSLMPDAVRRACARAALRLPWPAPLGARWQRAAIAKSGCGGCRHALAVHGERPPSSPTTVHLVRKIANR